MSYEICPSLTTITGGDGSTAASPSNPLPVALQKPVVVSKFFCTAAPDSDPIPTNEAPWESDWIAADDFVAQSLVCRFNQGVKGNVAFSYSRSATGTPAVDGIPIPFDDGLVILPIELATVGLFFKFKIIPDSDSPAVTYGEATLYQYRTAPPPLAVREDQALIAASPLSVVRARVEPSTTGQRGLLGASRALFGEALVAERVAQIEYDFTKPVANNRLTLGTPTGGATLTQGNTGFAIDPTIELVRETTTTNVSQITSIAYSPDVGRYVAVRPTVNQGTNSQIWYSDTGEEGTWISATLPLPGASGFLYDVCWNPAAKLFCAVGSFAFGIGNVVLTSPDGINWTSQTSGSVVGFYAVTYFAPIGFVAVGNNAGVGGISTSPDGVLWTDRTTGLGASTILNSIAVSGTTAVAVGLGGTIITSTDGITWTSRTSGTTTEFISVAYNPVEDAFLTLRLSSTETRRASGTGITWTLGTALPVATGATLRTPRAVTWHSFGVFVACATNGTGVTGVYYTIPTTTGAYTARSNAIGTARNNYCAASYPGKGLVIGGGTTGIARITRNLVGTISSAEGVLATGSAATSYHSYTTVKKTRYYPAKGIWGDWSSRFVVPTHFNSFQRHGLFNINAAAPFNPLDGLYVGTEGLTFGLTHANNGQLAFTPITQFNGDRMDSRFGSKFTKRGRLQDFDMTKRNIFRVIVGFLGSNVAELWAEAPDGVFILLHTFNFPNNLAGSNFNVNSFGLTAQVGKANADATILLIGSGSGAAGSEVSSFGLEPSDVKGRDYVQATGTVAGLVTPTTGTIRANTTGRRVRLKTLAVGYSKTANVGGEITITDGIGGPVRARFQLASLGANTADNFVRNYPEGIIFDTAVCVAIPGIGLGAQCGVDATGYEEAM